MSERASLVQDEGKKVTEGVLVLGQLAVAMYQIRQPRCKMVELVKLEYKYWIVHCIRSLDVLPAAMRLEGEAAFESGDFGRS
jgi:hypothetical protein